MSDGKHNDNNNNNNNNKKKKKNRGGGEGGMDGAWGSRWGKSRGGTRGGGRREGGTRGRELMSGVNWVKGAGTQRKGGGAPSVPRLVDPWQGKSVIAVVGLQAGLVARIVLPGELQHFRPPVIGEADAPPLQTSGSSTARGILEDQARSETAGAPSVSLEAAVPPVERERHRRLRRRRSAR